MQLTPKELTLSLPAHSALKARPSMSLVSLRLHSRAGALAVAMTTLISDFRALASDVMFAPASGSLAYSR